MHVLACGDFHCGSTVGLYNPDTRLVRADEKGRVWYWTPDPTETQEWLWRDYTEFVAKAAKTARRLIVIHGGDITQGDRWDGLMPDVSRSDQRQIAVDCLKPLVKLRKVQHTFLITGTEVHVPESAEAKVAAKLAEKTGRRVQSYHHSRITIKRTGTIFDVAHHGPSAGTRDWLKGNVARYHLKDRIYLDRRLGKRPADVYLSGHFHELVHEMIDDEWQGERRTIHLVVVPSFQGRTAYARKATRSVPYLNTGIVLFRLDPLQFIPLVKTRDLRTEVEV